MAYVPQPPVVRYALAAPSAGWELPEETMPESLAHDAIVTLLRELLAAWVTRSGKGQVARNLAIRWDESRPKVGVDPDVALLVPAPPEGEDLKSVRTWLEGHAPPVVAVEVVSESDPRKDYVIAPDKYAASGTEELWIFDPLLCGPASQGGPFRLQVWRRDGGDFVRVYAGEGPAHSTALDAYLVVVADGRRLRLASDAGATDFWRTAEEAARAARDEALAAKDEALAAKDEALVRVAQLEAELTRRSR